ncbi:MAG TPA: helix-turn-helix transcriptional regulator [Thermoanaerobaculia bacterium]
MARTMPPALSLTLTLLRSARGWTQKDLAKATGIPSSVLSDYEKGRRALSRPKLDKLAAALGMEPEATEVSIFCAGFIRPEEGMETSGSPADLNAAESRLARRAAALAARWTGERTRNEMVRFLQARKIRQARKEAEDLWERLKQYSPRERRVLVEGGREFRTWALCEKLCAESGRAAAADAERAMDLADLALRVAVRVTGEERWCSQVQGYAWAFVGNARRVANDLPGAEEAFIRAWDLWGAEANGGEAKVLSEWRLLDLEASLRRDQRRLSEALGLLDRALMQQSGDEGRILLKKAFTLEQMGEYERAIDALTHAADAVNDQSEPRLFCVLKFNLAVNLCHLGRYQRASALIPEIRELALNLGNELDLVRLLWLEGRIAVASGGRPAAITALEQVRGEFISRNLAYDTALVSLELAVLYLEAGLGGEVQVLAREMAPIFRAQGVHREALAALSLFCESVENHTATVELARRLAEYLRRARHQPGLKFEA